MMVGTPMVAGCIASGRRRWQPLSRLFQRFLVSLVMAGPADGVYGQADLAAVERAAVG